MAIARDMWPQSILGIDIDPSLINKARKVVNQYASRKVPSAMATPNPEVEQATRTEQLFPQSLSMIFGPLDPTQPMPGKNFQLRLFKNEKNCLHIYFFLIPASHQQQQPPPHSQVQLTPLRNTSLFPHNIKFKCDNYVLEDDELLGKSKCLVFCYQNCSDRLF